MTRTRSASWSDIPLELAGLVLLRLPAHVDRVHFAAVCPQWRAATRVVPLPPPLPLLALPDGTVHYSKTNLIIGQLKDAQHQKSVRAHTTFYLEQWSLEEPNRLGQAIRRTPYARPQTWNFRGAREGTHRVAIGEIRAQLWHVGEAAVLLQGSMTVSETLGEGKTEKVSIILSGYSSRILKMRRVPMPEPVPPPREWHTWNPACVVMDQRGREEMRADPSRSAPWRQSYRP
ncbi:hypothetical protein EJB05_26888, partial [Eragrostis curvula]